MESTTSQETAQLLRKLLAIVESGELQADSPKARALLRRLEGAVIALDLSSLSPTSDR